jgi:hypothetical protein
VYFAIIVVVATVLAAANSASASRLFGRRGCDCPGGVEQVRIKVKLFEVEGEIPAVPWTIKQDGWALHLDSEGSIFQSLRPLREAGKLRILGEPRLVTLSGREASYEFNTTHHPWLLAITKTYIQISPEYTRTVSRLDLFPTTLRNGAIDLGMKFRVVAEDQENPSPDGDQKIPLRVREFSANVVARPGELILVGEVKSSPSSSGDGTGKYVFAMLTLEIGCPPLRREIPPGGPGLDTEPAEQPEPTPAPRHRWRRLRWRN